MGAAAVMMASPGGGVRPATGENCIQNEAAYQLPILVVTHGNHRPQQNGSYWTWITEVAKHGYELTIENIGESTKRMIVS